jgi:hypothetical protein
VEKNQSDQMFTSDCERLLKNYISRKAEERKIHLWHKIHFRVYIFTLFRSVSLSRFIFLSSYWYVELMLRAEIYTRIGSPVFYFYSKNIVRFSFFRCRIHKYKQEKERMREANRKGVYCVSQQLKCSMVVVNEKLKAIFHCKLTRNYLQLIE